MKRVVNKLRSQDHTEKDLLKHEQDREPRALPRLSLNPAVTDLFAFKYEDIILENYDPHPAIKAQVAV